MIPEQKRCTDYVCDMKLPI